MLFIFKTMEITIQILALFVLIATGLSIAALVESESESGSSGITKIAPKSGLVNSSQGLSVLLGTNISFGSEGELNVAVVTGGVSQILKGEGITLNPSNGLGAVTVGVGNIINTGGTNTNTGTNSLLLGGANNVVSGLDSGIVGGNSNGVSGPYSGIVGGFNNNVSGHHSGIMGGNQNDVSGPYSGTVGGNQNDVSGPASGIVGGQTNNVSASGSGIMGGLQNDVSGDYSGIFGGTQNDVSGSNAGIVGGLQNVVSGTGSGIVGGQTNNIYAGADRSGIVGGANNGVSGRASGIMGGDTNTVSGSNAGIVGGVSNSVSGSRSGIVGGNTNNVSGRDSGIVGGNSNVVSVDYSGIVGGTQNDVSGNYAGIVGGANNNVSGNYAGIVGGVDNIVSTLRSVALGGQGLSTFAGTSYAGDVALVGKYNSNGVSEFASSSGGTSFRFVVGGGTADNNRKNAFSVDNIGNLYFGTTAGTSIYHRQSNGLFAAKAFTIQHPEEEDKWLVHGCLEGPEAGVYYRGKDIAPTEVSLPSYASKIADNFSVQLTPIGKARNMATSEVDENGHFQVDGEGAFFWQVTGTRITINPEPYKKDTTVRRVGPYTWHE